MKFKQVYIEITNICNLHCSFCERTSKKPRTMTPEEFEHILKEINEYTDYIYLHVQGEPLLSPYLSQILDIATKYQKKVNIVTNGTLIAEQIDMLVKSPALRQVAFSLHSFTDHNPEKYLSPILLATEALLANGKIVSYRFWNQDLENTNNEQIKIIEEYFNIVDLKSMTKIKKNFYLSKDTSFIWPNMNNEYYSEKGTCYGLRTHLAILVDGTVVPCCLDKDGIISLGNIYEESFKNIISSEKVKKIRQGFLNNKKEDAFCRKCNFIE